MDAATALPAPVARLAGHADPAQQPGPAARLADAVRLADTAATVRDAAALLRQHLAPWRVVVVDALDMRAEIPAVRGARRWLYLAASDGHCWSVTDDPARAVGLYLCDGAAP